MYARAARSAVYFCVGMTVMTCANRLAMSLDTTTQVRVFLGSAPTDGSQLTQRTSPRRMSSGSAVLIAHDLKRDRLPVLEQLQGVVSALGVIARELLRMSKFLAPLEARANQRRRE